MEQGLMGAGAGEARWAVDLAAAGRVARWAKSRALLTEEVREMGTYFPRWVLTAGGGGRGHALGGGRGGGGGGGGQPAAVGARGGGAGRGAARLCGPSPP